MEFDRQFAKSVLERAKSCSGLRLEQKTIENYTHRIMTLKNLGLITEVAQPQILYSSLRQRYNSPGTILTMLKPAAVFVANLNQGDLLLYPMLRRPQEDAPQQYRALFSALNSEVKEQKKAKCV